jgi:hypothetical protein
LSDLYMGVRVRFVLHNDNTVNTCSYRTTEENKRACLTAIAALEGVTYEELLTIIERDLECRASMKIDHYRSSGGE